MSLCVLRIKYPGQSARHYLAHIGLVVVQQQRTSVIFICPPVGPTVNITIMAVTGVFRDCDADTVVTTHDVMGLARHPELIAADRQQLTRLLV